MTTVQILPLIIYISYLYSLVPIVMWLGKSKDAWVEFNIILTDYNKHHVAIYGVGSN